jgi:hypothetical protein
MDQTTFIIILAVALPLAIVLATLVADRMNQRHIERYFELWDRRRFEHETKYHLAQMESRLNCFGQQLSILQFELRRQRGGSPE